MRKGLFLSVPSISVEKTLNPVVDELCDGGYEIVRYNTREFAPHGGRLRTFKPYPSYDDGFDTARQSRRTSYFDYAEMLLDTAAALHEFLRQEVETESPDFILHSHLALWGKVLAARCRIPAVALYSTFILDSRIMIPVFRAQKQEGRGIIGDMQQFVRCQRKYRALYDGVDRSYRPDIWDAYVNKERLNVSFVLGAFQEQIDLFAPPAYRFVGHPSQAAPGPDVERRLIYMALGTILNDDVELCRLSVKVCARLQCPGLIVRGKVPKEALGPIPEHVTVAEFVDQEAVLGDAAIFVTMGGMASVHEAVSALVPMIIMPETPEQHITARRIEALGIGVYMNREHVTEEALLAVIRQMLTERASYDEHLRALKASRPAAFPARLARTYITEYLEASASARCETIVS
jgi:MGT family glycosyltransferase